MIVDCCLFFNELDLLELRFRELDRVVDRFVVVESTLTHAGQPKPLYFLDNQTRFRPWLNKVTHVVAEPLPGDGIPATRRREMSQRNAILRGLYDVPDDAVILISDCDEIPRATHVPPELPDGMVVVYDQTLHYFNFNTQSTNARWRGTRAARAADVRALSPHIVRYGIGTPDSHYPNYAMMHDAGWHFSYFGDVAHVQGKMRSFLHQELVNEENTDPDTIARRISEGVDIWGREDQKFELRAAADLPDAVLENLDSWLPYFHPDWRPVFHENWYTGAQALYVAALAQSAPEGGALVEIGAWEGRSTTVIAQKVAPRVLHVVDWWKGNPEESDDHPAARAARERDVYATFEQNINRLTTGNMIPEPFDWRDWLMLWKTRPLDRQSIAFLHLDAAHDYESVRDCLIAIKPFLVPGAILCGDDGYSDPVWRAVREVFPQAKLLAERLWVVEYADND